MRAAHAWGCRERAKDLDIAVAIFERGTLHGTGKRLGDVFAL